MSDKKPRPRPIAQRTCVVCRQKTDKRRLTRLVRTQDEQEIRIVVDPTGKMPGRGAYVCDNQACRHRVVETEVLAQALRTEISAQYRTLLRNALLPETATRQEA